MIPVILSGGSGSRLWPLSRKGFPKQFLPLIGDESMLQATLSRLPGDMAAPIVVANFEHKFIVADQLLSIGVSPSAIFLEPFGRNTAAAIALAAFEIVDKRGDDLMLVLPADHHIPDKHSFHSLLEKGAALANAGNLVLFGITPNGPETGFGYIEKGDSIGEHGFMVAGFKEKPSLAVAQEYVDSGKYLWNGGMFLMRPSVFLSELEQFEPKVFTTCRDVYKAITTKGTMRIISSDLFAQCPDISVDYAVMERTRKAATLALNAGWSDLGAWSALWEAHEKDANGNVILGDVITQNSANCFVRSDKLVSLIGVDELVVVDTPDALLVAHRDSVQDVKNTVNELIKLHRGEALIHREVYRPWGTYDTVDSGVRHEVKRIKIKAGESLSLHRHHHRAEHWIVVQGTAKVTCGDKVFFLAENESTHIPVGEVHRLENPGKIVLEIIEVRSGGYVGEDDIERLEDNYDRVVVPMVKVAS